VQTVSENDKDPPAVVADKPAPIDARVLNVKNVADKRAPIDKYWARVLNVKNVADKPAPIDEY